MKKIKMYQETAYEYDNYQVIEELKKHIDFDIAELVYDNDIVSNIDNCFANVDSESFNLYSLYLFYPYSDKANGLHIYVRSKIESGKFFNNEITKEACISIKDFTSNITYRNDFFSEEEIEDCGVNLI